jgi:hypothetical protein
LRRASRKADASKLAALDLAQKENGFYNPSTRGIFLNWFRFTTAPLNR